VNYRSHASLLGLPLVHVRTTELVDGRARRGIALGWIAIGDIACGVILSVGGVALGGISVGGLGLGLVSLAGLSVGGYAVGGLAIGFLAVGGLALAWQGALGGAAIAKGYAVGGLAIAEHANDPEAQEFMRTSAIRFGRMLAEHSRWLLILVLLPAILAWWNRRQDGDPTGSPPPSHWPG
jgi:hypothetical protein